MTSHNFLFIDTCCHHNHVMGCNVSNGYLISLPKCASSNASDQDMNPLKETLTQVAIHIYTVGSVENLLSGAFNRGMVKP